MNPFAALKAALGAFTGTEHQPLARGGTRARRGNPQKKARGYDVNGRPRSPHAKACGGGRIAADPMGDRMPWPCGYDRLRWEHIHDYAISPKAKPPRGSLAWQREREAKGGTR